MVAMFGLIMPAPLLMPVMVTVWPPMVTVRDAAFGWVSVVMIASAALNQLSSFRFSMAAGRPATIFSTGSGSRITPVENGRICCGVAAEQAGQRGAGLRALSPGPISPVPALALPVLTTSARIGAPPAVDRRQVRLADLDRRGAEAVGGEHAGHGGASAPASSPARPCGSAS